MCTLSAVFLFFSSLLLFFCGMVFIMEDLVMFVEWEVVSLNSMNIVMTLLLDWMSLIFMSFVLMISAMVIYYSKEYMSDEENMDRFIILVLMFVLSMVLLIISPNLISILLGWDGLGLVSYLLVIYYQNVKSYGAGMLTALANRIGDVALLLSIAWMLNYGSWNYVFYLEEMESSDMVVVGGLVLVAGMTKSAQIPFSSWLPAAMAAPTPVSALVHSSTLVTAGVYLLIRFNILICETWVGSILLLLSGLTMFMAGLGANYEFDLKKIIALSTLSQLGLMMSILAMGFYKLAFFHLLTHALFKALLFMCAGAVIHNMNNNQDIRFMGGLSLMMPMTSSCFNVANLALCGMPFLAGFYSKDLILEMVSLSYVNVFIFVLFFASTGLTACYSFRLVYYTMTGSCKNISLSMVSDEGWIMLTGMIGLLSLSIVGGSMLSWLIFPSPVVICLPLHLKLLTLFVFIGGSLLGYLVSNVSLYFFNKSLYFYRSSNFLGSMWFMPYISTYGIINVPLMMGGEALKGFDQGWSEYFGGQQLFNKLVEDSQINQVLQDNSLKIYLLSFVFWIIILASLSVYF
uniref:NADH-ubiquinone oxidoreductase chain 5 n=1 Tax=Gyrostigma rhinocerontis TaxID=2583772 RepID=A0A4P9JIF0_9MUSC|nr:NADH dehydrogenase subunit 5 [Gyrostigma rhinocerontis]QCU81307.1 NADH dehydrogenase subunit 5 [Gyrostigma rhinocerontis]